MSRFSLFSEYYHQDLDLFFRSLVPNGKTDTKVFADEGITGKYDYLLLPNSFVYLEDVQEFIAKLKKHCYPTSRVVVVYYSFLWRPLLILASLLGLRKKDKKEPNWLTPPDIANLFILSGFDEVVRGKRFLFPLKIRFISDIINRFIAQLPFINALCLTSYQIFRLIPAHRDYSVSIVIPVRNEEGNIQGILKKIPKLGSDTEVIFVEGHSQDNTYRAIIEEISQLKNRLKAYLYRQKGEGKGDAVRMGFAKAKNEILMILDADLTVDPKELTKFYRALCDGYAEFVNGSRLVYPLEKQAMRTLNYLGNALFSKVFTFLLGQRVKDTLCGTKVLFRRDYIRIEKNRSYFGNFDPFGDFDLLFGASKLHLKIIEIPVRYKARTYGETNISRFRHGWLLLKMAIIGAKKTKFV